MPRERAGVLQPSTLGRVHLSGLSKDSDSIPIPFPVQMIAARILDSRFDSRSSILQALAAEDAEGYLRGQKHEQEQADRDGRAVADVVLLEHLRIHERRQRVAVLAGPAVVHDPDRIE